MICPKCKKKVKVLDLAIDNYHSEMYKKLHCEDCSYTFFTVEFEVEENKQFKKIWHKYKRRKKYGKRSTDYKKYPRWVNPSMFANLKDLEDKK